MNIIKLSAINSTNDYLKGLSSAQYLENFTIVSAEDQTAGRGQMGAQWNVEPGKNLTFSVLVKDLLLDVTEIFSLNAAVAVSVVGALENFSVPNLFIKWPNDILADNKKIGGILIENSIKSGGEIYSVIGIGLNVNQKEFGELTKASSLAVVMNKEFDKDAIMTAIVESLKRNVAILLNKNGSKIWKDYHAKLYKKGLPMPFEKNGVRFMGIIQGVSQKGELKVQLEDDTVKAYGIKEVQLLY
ncbi:biotin--[acetyl-CoA-carboxylase] ligase [Flavobacterium sp. AG291]|uniref:biotin--[acetyl-CoA-carboxylase] ligase n=1 Tax=Flavobacterium sp. AG291 TaxID=2184000 RepID=UPI000E0ABDEB|nr:biotin--[acetyl-CoA-carboxylase] ligase [Flavobacterium sp. AG291]RDI13103.1 BirA family biotin operon repressor/biotin-[acetyl-CoA-carboxylase] ligase [Flavobacterium sp. AG291]